MIPKNDAADVAPQAPSVIGLSSGIEVSPLPGLLGADVHCDVRSLDRDGAAAIRQAFLDHLVLRIRGQDLSDDDLVRFGSLFGELAAPLPPEHAAEGVRTRDEYDNPMVSVVSNVVENGKAIGNLGDGEAQWHSDFSYHAIPYAASILYAIEIPTTWGGQTSILNMYAALDTLPASTRRLIEGMTVKNDQSTNSVGLRRKGVPDSIDVRVSPGPSHPIVRTHAETGYNALYLGRRPFAYINGLPVDESEDILNELWTHAAQERFVWTNEWEKGDILMWDNRCTMHHRKAFDPTSRRIMHRVQTIGDRPVFSPRKSRSEAHPRAGV